MSTLLLVLALATCLLLVSCSRPRYWVHGLVLPPDATEVAREVKNDQETQSQKRKRTLHVSFDSKLDWAGVAAHFDECLDSAGYKETADTSLFGQTGRQPDYRCYTSPARKETVILHDHQPSRNQMAQVGLGRRDGPGRYELTVYRK
jgi:hypothetical protein